ncbi:MAG: hypothetical protein ABIV06_05255 [Thermoanaerobaculia bacterium]
MTSFRRFGGLIFAASVAVSVPAIAGAPDSPPVSANAAPEAQARARRLETVARLAAGVAHDLNNLLNFIVGQVESAVGRGTTFRLFLEASRPAQSSAAPIG